MLRKKVLIIRLSSIGDILLTTPFIRQVHRRFPGADIEFVVKSKFKELITFNPHINKIHSLDGSSKHALRKLKRDLKKIKYDYIFDLHNNYRSIFLRTGLSCNYKGIIRKDKVRQAFLLYFKLNFYKNPKSIPQRYLETGLKSGVRDDNLGLELYWTKEISDMTNSILADLDINQAKNFICLAPGAGFFTKRWPIFYFAQLVDLIRSELKAKVVVLGGEEDKNVTAELSRSSDVYNLSGKINLLESAAIISKSSALVSNDTGLMHLAAAVNTPMVAIFGSSVVEWGFRPFRVAHTLIEEKELKCRPCSHIGRNSCPKKHFKCMLNISPERVFKELNLLLYNRQILNE
jgi:lipopolysaccharide heptosyltransferase II